MPVRTLRDLDQPSANPMPGMGGYQSYQNSTSQQEQRRQNASNTHGLAPAPSGVFPSMCATLAPDFSWSYFLGFMTAIQIIMFFVELIYGGVVYGQPFDPNNVTAGPGVLTLRDLGGKDTYLIQKGQIWRLVTPIFLHGGVLHIFFNLFFQCMLCFTYEKDWGFYRTAVFYFLTGIGASLMSGVCDASSVSVGASGALAGMLGCRIGWIFLNWNAPSSNPEMASFMGDEEAPFSPGNSKMAMESCNLFLIILLNFSMTMTGGMSGAAIDNYAHLGGLLSGVLLGTGFPNRVDGPVSCCQPSGKIINAFKFLSVAYFFVLLYLLFLIVQP